MVLYGPLFLGPLQCVGGGGWGGVWCLCVCVSMCTRVRERVCACGWSEEGRWGRPKVSVAYCSLNWIESVCLESAVWSKQSAAPWTERTMYTGWPACLPWNHSPGKGQLVALLIFTQRLECSGGWSNGIHSSGGFDSFFLIYFLLPSCEDFKEFG